MAALLAMLLTVALSPPFGDADAAALDLGPPFVVEVTVEVVETLNAVLIRPVAAEGELDPVAMVEQDDGTWIGIVSLGARQDILLAFEAIGPEDSTATISELYALSDLGVDPAVFAADMTPPTTAASGRTLPAGIGWLIAGGLLLAGALLLLAIWAGSGRNGRPGAGSRAGEDDG